VAPRATFERHAREATQHGRVLRYLRPMRYAALAGALSLFLTLA
jgi:hypothetical protein